MAWLDEKFSSSETLAWGSALVGFSVFVPSIYWLNNSVNNAVCNNVNETCGTTLSYDQCKQFQSEYLVGENGRFGISGLKTALGDLVKHPIKFFKDFKQAWSDVFNGLKTMGPKTATPLISQEVSYFIGASAFQFDLAFLVEDLGGSFLATLPFSVGLCWTSTMIRRAIIINNIGQKMRYFGHPSPQVCESARQFEEEKTFNGASFRVVEENPGYARNLLAYANASNEPLYIPREINFRDYLQGSGNYALNDVLPFGAATNSVFLTGGAGSFSFLPALRVIPVLFSGVFIMIPNFEEILETFLKEDNSI